MNMQILAQNVRRLRAVKKFSQKALADAAGISLPAIKNLELGKSEPRMRTVQEIARALGVKLQELFLPVRPLKAVRFRSARKMQNRENVLAKVARWLDHFDYIEQSLKKKVPFLLKQAGKHCSRKQIAEAARLCRKKLGLKPTEPIHNICGLLEHAGIRVLSVPMASDGFFGLSVGETDGGPAIIVNAWERIPVERKIFSAAHELGHLMLHPKAYKVSEIQENRQEEKEADVFASHFLLPDEGFRKKWNEASGLHLVDRVIKVKRIFRVSYKTILFRLIDHGVADNKIWARFQRDFQEKYNRKLRFKEEPMAKETKEPYGYREVDFFENRFSRLVREAVDKDKISVSRGAEMLGVGIEEMRDLLQSCEAIL